MPEEAFDCRFSIDIVVARYDFSMAPSNVVVPNHVQYICMWIRNKMFMLNSQFSGIKRLMLLPSIYIATEPSSLYKWSENKVWFDVSSMSFVWNVRFSSYSHSSVHVASDCELFVLSVVRASVRLAVYESYWGNLPKVAHWDDAFFGNSIVYWIKWEFNR